MFKKKILRHLSASSIVFKFCKNFQFKLDQIVGMHKQVSISDSFEIWILKYKSFCSTILIFKLLSLTLSLAKKRNIRTKKVGQNV